MPENLLREARRQKILQDCKVPAVCMLDPDGDLAQYLISKGAEKNACWACYHSKLYSFTLDDTVIGVVPFVVGAPYAVLVDEQLFVSGCELLIGVTSAGIISSYRSERFALITEAVRDEGTSYHYLPAGSPAVVDDYIFRALSDGTTVAMWSNAKSWTMDAPYRET